MQNKLDSREVAEMVGKEHSKLLRDIRNYVSQLAEAKIGLGDFFIEDTYLDVNNQNRPCYLITKKGCEFIAHKLTGQKGTEFTARYINRFHEMENQIKQVPLTEHPGEVANLIKVLATLMNKQGNAPFKSAEMAQMICSQYGIKLPEDFVNVPQYEQLTLDDIENY